MVKFYINNKLSNNPNYIDESQRKLPPPTFDITRGVCCARATISYYFGYSELECINISL